MANKFVLKAWVICPNTAWRCANASSFKSLGNTACNCWACASVSCNWIRVSPLLPAKLSAVAISANSIFSVLACIGTLANTFKLIGCCWIWTFKRCPAVIFKRCAKLCDKITLLAWVSSLLNTSAGNATLVTWFKGTANGSSPNNS